MDYQKKKIIELMCIAHDRGIKYYGQMKKGKLIEMLKANDEDPSVVNDPEFIDKCKRYNEEWKKNNPERMQHYRDKFRKDSSIYYHKKKKEAKENITDQKNYDEMNIIELKRAASLRKIKYCGVMSRGKLIEMLKANDEDPSATSDPEFDEKCKALASEQWRKNLAKNRERVRSYYYKRQAKKLQEIQSE